MKVLYNAVIHTLDSQAPKFDALVIENGRVIAAGKNGDILNLYGKAGVPAQPGVHQRIDTIELINLEGRAVIPGLTDAHIHLEHYALGLQKVDCETSTKAECLHRVAERARITPPGQWILGHGWNQNNWSEGFGSASDLDEIAPHNPVLLTAKSLHAAWVNQSALHMAGISANSSDPQDGRIGRDAKGQPDGILFESAMQLVYDQLPETTVADVRSALLAAQPALWKCGLTGVHDFDRRLCFQALQQLHKSGELSMRVVKSIPLDDLPHAAALGLSTGFGDDFLRIGSVKAFADGALGPQTAAMLQPFEGESSNRGILMLDSEELFEKGCLAVDNGLSLAVHAIGDRANHEVLNAFAQLRQYEKRQPTRHQGSLRHRIEHVQLLHPDDVPRLGELGIIASMQPIHATSDMLMADRFWGLRSALAYAWRSQLDNGAVLAFGSDAPVESPNPFWGLHAALTRRRLDGTPALEGWYPQQRVSLLEALAGFTTAPAYAAGVEDHLGKLIPGFLADLLVLDRDPFTLDADEIRNLEPTATMVNGDWVFVR